MVCSSDFSITSVSAKWPGSVHDSRVLRESELGKTLERGMIYYFHLSVKVKCMVSVLYACKIFNPVSRQIKLKYVLGRKHSKKKNNIFYLINLHIGY